ncbi:MAG: DUF1003 domain-containing protein [Nanoarchaeota archaeon]|nr:DUF1003 domain-containing protein [Nanoarchaeota archaeon]
MAKNNSKNVTCQICRQEKEINEVTPAEVVRSSVAELIKKKHKDWGTKGFICHDDLNHFREEYIKNVIETETGELSALESEVVKSMKQHELLTKNINAEFERKLTSGEKLSDKIAEFGGSWKFIIIFFIILASWILLNAITFVKRPFDPYPFILLNLILSCLAAMQAPIIMMSQNRLEAKDRMRAEHDYRINLKAELEIRHLHEKIDHLLRHQWQRLLEIQNIQTELMEEIMRGNKTGK